MPTETHPQDPPTHQLSVQSGAGLFLVPDMRIYGAISEAEADQRHGTPADSLQPLSLTRLTRLLLRIPGGPKSKAQLQGFRDDVANRFEGQWEHAVEYINKWNDRLLNKARGLLTFHGLVLALLGTVYRESRKATGFRPCLSL